MSPISPQWMLVCSIEVGWGIGFGHLKRCLTIARQARSTNAAVAFHVVGDVEAGGDEVRAAGFTCDNLSGQTSLANTVVLVDRVHAAVIADPRALLADIESWRGRGARVALLDTAGDTALRRRWPALKLDAVIAPYAGEVEDAAAPWRCLGGLAYVPIAPEYSQAPSRTARPSADRVLVTCGGSDPFELTARIVAALADIRDRSLTVRIILGPGFMAGYRARVMQLSRGLNHAVEFVEAPPSLAPQMAWCDIAVASSGLTKYELAAAGTPAILLSPDAMHDRANGPFQALGTAVDLGLAERVEPGDIAAAICALLDDRARRAAIMQAGRTLVDGAGAARIVAALKELMHAQP